jgi:hypothetical protein
MPKEDMCRIYEAFPGEQQCQLQLPTPKKIFGRKNFGKSRDYNRFGRILRILILGVLSLAKEPTRDYYCWSTFGLCWFKKWKSNWVAAPDRTGVCLFATQSRMNFIHLGRKPIHFIMRGHAAPPAEAAHSRRIWQMRPIMK